MLVSLRMDYNEAVPSKRPKPPHTDMHVFIAAPAISESFESVP